MIDASKPPLKMAIAGKGGTGKTTIAGTLARTLAESGRRVWAVDADSTPNLGLTLGLPRETLGHLPCLPRDILGEHTDEEGRRQVRLGMPPAELAATYGTAAPGGVQLLLMGQIDHAGAG